MLKVNGSVKLDVKTTKLFERQSTDFDLMVELHFFRTINVCTKLPGDLSNNS